MAKKNRYPVLRYGYLYAFEKELETPESREEIKKKFENKKGGWDQTVELSENMLKLLIKDGVINNIKVVEVKPFTNPKQCEGLIIKCPRRLIFSLSVGPQIVDVEVRLSLTICRDPHLSKIWVSFVVHDGIGVNGSNLVIESAKVFDGISDKLASIVCNKYQEYHPEKIIEIHRLFIKAIGDPEILLKEFVDKIESKDGYRIQKQLTNNNETVFESVKPIISLSFEKEPGNIGEYNFFLGADRVQWAVFQTLDQKKKGLFIKRHVVDSDPPTTVIAGSVCGEIDATLELTRSIIRTLAPFL